MTLTKRKGNQANIKWGGTIVQGVGELRNGYGTGHGKMQISKDLKSSIKLLVGVVSEIAIYI